MTERLTLPLSRARQRLAASGARLVLPPHEAVLRAFDKAYTTELATSLGLAVPRTWTIECDAERSACSRLPYPVVVKPRSSEERGARQVRYNDRRADYARNRAEFLEAWTSISTRCRAALVQEFVEGDGVGLFALMRDGEPRRSLRTAGCGKPPADRAAPCA